MSTANCKREVLGCEPMRPLQKFRNEWGKEEMGRKELWINKSRESNQNSVKVEWTSNKRKRFSLFAFSKTKICHMLRCIEHNELFSLATQSFNCFTEKTNPHLLWAQITLPSTVLMHYIFSLVPSTESGRDIYPNVLPQSKFLTAEASVTMALHGLWLLLYRWPET